MMVEVGWTWRRMKVRREQRVNERWENEKKKRRKRGVREAASFQTQ